MARADLRGMGVWAVIACVALWALWVAATSPLLQWRAPVYIASGLLGVVALALIVVQPVLAVGRLPGLSPRRGRRLHRWTGGLLVCAVVGHVVGLWITSPPDVVDALLLRSPTPFSVWGVAAMWALFAAAGLALFRKRAGMSLRVWRLGHSGLVVCVAAGTVVHALLVEGTMGAASKIALCALALAAVGKTVWELRSWRAR